MKKIIHILGFILLSLLSSTTANAAHFSVTDSLHIKTTLSSSKKALLEQIIQGITQEEQLKGLYSQITQIDDFLTRLGKLEEVRDLPGFDEAAEAFVRRLELNLPTIEILKSLDLEDLFKQGESSPYEKIERDIIVDGKKVSEVEASAVKPQLAFRKTVENYERVRSSVLNRRSQLKGELEETMNLLRAATTKAEVDKLSAVVNALTAQIAATDSDMSFASQEVTTRYYLNKVEKEIQQEVQQQRDVASLKSRLRQSLEIFTVPSSPALFKPRNKQ